MADSVDVDRVQLLEDRIAKLEAVIAALQKAVQVATLPDGPPDPGKR